MENNNLENQNTAQQNPNPPSPTEPIAQQNPVQVNSSTPEIQPQETPTTPAQAAPLPSQPVPQVQAQAPAPAPVPAQPDPSSQPIEPTTSPSSDKTYTPVFILGILSIVFAFTIIGSFIGIILGIIGIVLAIKYKKSGGKKKAGLVMSIVGTSFGAFWTILVFVLAFAVFLGSPYGNWSCQLMSLNTGETSSIYTADISLGLGYSIDLSSNGDNLSMSGDSWEFELEDKHIDDLTYYMVTPGEVTAAKGEGTSSIIGSNPTKMEFVIDNSKNPREAVVVLTNSMRAFSCVEK